MLTKFLFFAVFFMGFWAQAAGPQVYEEKKLFYSDLKDGKTDWLQTSTEFFPANSALKLPSFVDLYEVTKNKNGIGSYVVVRSSFYLGLGIDQIRGRMVNPQTLSMHSKRLKVLSCVESRCKANIKTTFADINVQVAYGLVEKKNASGPWESFFTALHNPDFVAAQEFTKIETVFAQGSSFSAFYSMGPELTWVQSYQIFSLKDSAYEKARMIPFFNLEKNVRGVIRDMILDARSAVLQERKYSAISASPQRMPAVSGHDRGLYSQDSYKLVDTDGDEALIQRAEVVPGHILKALFNDDKFSSSTDPWKPEVWESEDPLAGKVTPPAKPSGPSVQGREKPIHVEKFSEMLDQVLFEESQRGLTPVVGAFHEWSPETREKHLGKNAVVGFSKLFICLSLGFTNRFMKTGHEQDLWKWLVQQDYNSVTLPELFRASYRLSQGDVYLSLLTIENLLAANWRYRGREALPATKRLRPITSGYNYDKDKFGTWYHFFGMILYGYRTGSGFKANFVGRAEALGSNILSKGVDKTQKQWFNKLGGYIGEDLRESVATGRYQRGPSNPGVLAESYYLNRSEDFRDRLPLLQSQDLQLKAQAGMGGDSAIEIEIQNKGREDLLECVADIMTDYGAGYYAPFKIRRHGVSVEAQKTLTFSLPQERRRLKGVRVFIGECRQGNPQAMEWKR